MTRNEFKDRLRAGEPMCGMTVMLGEPTIVETSAAGGIDFLFVCLEHGTRSPDRLDAVARTAFARGIPAIARVPYPDGREVSRLIEMGYVGTILPHTRSVEQVKDFVAAHYHPPKGYRSYANCVRTGNWGLMEGTKYIETGDDLLVPSVMIEDAAAVENVDALLAVPDVELAAGLDSAEDHFFGHDAPPGNSRLWEAARLPSRTARRRPPHRRFRPGSERGDSRE